jgi:hypothetical protein
VNGSFCLDINAACEVVEKQNAGPGFKRPSKKHFLLIAAGEAADRLSQCGFR